MAITQEQLNMILGMNPPPPNSIRGDLQKELANMFQGGAPIRNAIGSALTGDFAPSISGLRNVGNEISALSNMKLPTNSNLDISKTFADVIDYAPMAIGSVGKVARPLTKYEESFDLAQKRASLPVSQGGLGLPANNTAMDRAKAMGNTTKAYTGANIEGEIDSILPKSWFSKEPEYSSKYSTTIPFDGISKDPRMYPVLINTGKVKSQPYFGLYEDMEKALSKKGTNTFKVENVGGGTNDFYVPKEGSQVRSIYAAFDPFRRNENDILGYATPEMLGLLSAGSVGGVTYANNKKKKTTKK